VSKAAQCRVVPVEGPKVVDASTPPKPCSTVSVRANCAPVATTQLGGFPSLL